MKICTVLVGIMMLVGCKSNDSPEALAEKMRSLGAYVEAGSMIMPVSTYGTEEHDVMDGSLTFKFAGPIPETKRVNHFYLNLPDANVSESKLYLLDDMSEAVWHPSKSDDASSPKPAVATIEPVSGSIYRFSSKEMSILEGGIVCLWASMPMGDSDRLYCVRLTGA